MWEHTPQRNEYREYKEIYVVPHILPMSTKRHNNLYSLSLIRIQLNPNCVSLFNTFTLKVTINDNTFTTRCFLIQLYKWSHTLTLSLFSWFSRSSTSWFFNNILDTPLHHFECASWIFRHFSIKNWKL